MKLKETHWWFFPLPIIVFMVWGIFEPHNKVPLLKLEKALPGNYQRIITLAPSLTEMVSAIGASSKIIGITESCDYPLEILNRPRVANYQKLYFERIVSLHPDLILAHDGGIVSREDLKRLSELSLKVVLVPQPSLLQIPEIIERLGVLLRYEDNAKLIADKFKNNLAEINNFKFSHKYKVLVQLERTPLYVAGKNSLIDDVITELGSQNIATNLAPNIPYPRLSIEAVLNLNPEVILIPLNKNDTVTFSNIKNDWKRFPNMSAVKNNKICLIEASTIVRPGPRIFEGINQIRDCIGVN